MNRNKINFCGTTVAMWLLVFLGHGQEVLREYAAIPQERIFVHSNSSLLFSGERLYYSIHCKDARTGHKSHWSQIAYMELIGDLGQLVLRQKIRLKQGIGQGDFFIPAQIPTGSYKMVGYTNWMKNEGPKNFYWSDIYIVNPYLATDPRYLKKESLDTAQVANMHSQGSAMVPKHEAGASAGLLSLKIDGEMFSKRDKVILKINVLDTSAIKGDYSISIKRREELVDYRPMGATEFMASLGGQNAKATIPDKDVFLPEARGELISGKVVYKDGALPAESRTVVISLPGENFVLDIARTNREGSFYFNLNGNYGDSDVIYQILGDDRDLFSLSMDKHESPDYGEFSSSPFQLSEEFAALIRERSIHSQIENAYGEVKIDSILPNTAPAPFYREVPLSYNLDDYTRFNGIDETMVEILDHVWMRKDEQGKRVFQVRPEEGEPDLGILPMVLVDGVVVQDHEGFLGYGAKKIQSVGVDRKSYLIGPTTFQGILSFKTVTGNFYKEYKNDYLVRDTLFKPEVLKKYHLQRGVVTGAQIPDFRYQLYWNPLFVPKTAETAIEFYTSDISGIFEVSLEGFAKNGTPVSLRTNFTVN
tara:strand:- start:80060 stop:81829 length:1770 start_codon:yes stop_codon:yes gene_type:complete